MFGFIIVSRSGNILPLACCELISMQAFHMWFPTTGYISASLGSSLKPHHKLGLSLPFIQVFSCFGTGVSCIYQTVPVWRSAFMKFFCVCRHAQCVCGNMFSHVSVCKCTWVYTIEAWTCVCRLEVHLVYIPQSSHLFFFHTGCLTEAEACQFG